MDPDKLNNSEANTFTDWKNEPTILDLKQDLDYANTKSLVLEYATRVGAGVTVNVDAFILMSDDIENISNTFKRDDYVQVSLNYYY